MQKIRVESSEVVKIEVNDLGEYIELNPLDLDFPMRLDKAVSELEKKTSLFKQALLVIDKKQDSKGDGILSKNEKERFMKYKEYLNDCGEIVDSVFGEGTTKKVFGDKAYFGMFQDFFNALDPILKETYGDTDTLIERIKNKYTKKDSDVLS